MTAENENPATRAAQEALAQVYQCIDRGESFLLEAGAGAGKTYSLVQALKYLIEKRGKDLLRRHQKIACITYTNVASNEIQSRTDRHPVIHSSTIHSFCWSLIKDFQPYLRGALPGVDKWWIENLEASGGIGDRTIGYDEFGHRKVEDSHASLHHNDVLALTSAVLGSKKFRTILASRYPIVLIDEYQDTDKVIANALSEHILDTGENPLLGFFGDHWQKIYGTGCGKIDHPRLKVIGKESNFRSVPVIVDILNRLRPELPQRVADPDATGSVAIYHTNQWPGERRSTQHWAGDLSAEAAHASLSTLMQQLRDEGWDFDPIKTKILMLTHSVLASEQGYSSIASIFPFNDSFIKKEDAHIKFLVESVEAACIAYKERRFGEVFTVLNGRAPAIRSHADKAKWSSEMDSLMSLRESGSIGDVIDHFRKSKQLHLPDAVERREREREHIDSDSEAEIPSRVERLRKLRDVKYDELTSLANFIDENTPFSTKHGVKGAEFEQVLVVIGRGWNLYNFNQFLEWAGNGIPSGKVDTFERNRNLFYVTCSRPMKRLAILFTQELSNSALGTLANWFGPTALHSLVPASVS
jgi:DNA helicase II / ATP-dependent DNA helicase PcrA